MASAMRLFRKYQWDGRIGIKTLSAVSAMVAVIALLVGVLPVFADHDGPHPLVDPGDPIRYGGGSGACSSDLGTLPSAAANELHINNPTTGTFSGPDGTEIEIVVTGETFSFDVLAPDMGVYDVVVNGGPQNLHYDYDLNVGIVSYDEGLHAPLKNNGDFHNLSHINICYDVGTQFECGATEALDPEGQFTKVEATIFTNSIFECPENGKVGSFFMDGGTVTIDFGAGTGRVAGMAVFEKMFDTSADISPLQYRLDESVSFVDIEWCTVRAKDVNGVDGEEFETWLGEDYPSLDGVEDAHDGTHGDAIACKVYEEEDATGFQFTVVYFELEDPQWR